MHRGGFGGQDRAMILEDLPRSRPGHRVRRFRACASRARTASSSTDRTAGVGATIEEAPRPAESRRGIRAGSESRPAIAALWLDRPSPRSRSPGHRPFLRSARGDPGWGRTGRDLARVREVMLARLQPGDTAKRRRPGDRPARLGAQRPGAHAAGHCRGRAARRAAGRPFEVPGIARRRRDRARQTAVVTVLPMITAPPSGAGRRPRRPSRRSDRPSARHRRPWAVPSRRRCP